MSAHCQRLHVGTLHVHPNQWSRSCRHILQGKEQGVRVLLTIQRDLSNIRVVVLASAVDFCPGKVADDAWKVQRTFVPGHIKCTSLTCMGVPMMVQVYSSIKLFREAVDAVGDMKLGRISVGRTSKGFDVRITPGDGMCKGSPQTSSSGNRTCLIVSPWSWCTPPLYPTQEYTHRYRWFDSQRFL